MVANAETHNKTLLRDIVASGLKFRIAGASRCGCLDDPVASAW